jgi:LemA protein
MYIIITIIISSLLLILLAINISNRIKTSRNQIDNALSSLDALLIKRSDLIPNLMVLLKQYMSHEKSTLEQITSLRQQANTAPQAEYTKDNQLNQLVKGLMIQVENYPELKADKQFANLHHSWNEAEEQIAAGRRFVSAAITDYNDTISVFPNSIVANMHGAEKYQWQQATEQQRQNINAEDYFK